MPIDRRSFLKMMGSGVAAAATPASISRALHIRPRRRHGTIADVEHVVFLMQENRSFDHYFGTLRGVRGFGDPRAVRTSGGQSIFYQPDGDGYVLPFRPTAPDLGLQFLGDLPHDWTTTHDAWNQGRYDRWVPNKGAMTMAYLTRDDIPFHYALAEAFTICDAYHCSVLSSTYPNRYHMLSGWVGNDGDAGGPAIDNAPGSYSWMTYPERLEKAGIRWKVYQDVGLGLNAAGGWGASSATPYSGNYGCNELLQFEQYQRADEGDPLAAKARTGTATSSGGTLFDELRGDIAQGNLPQVSWIIAPEAYSEHPNWPANYGAWYISQVLDALTEDPEVWSQTALFLTYDENDGFFDHIVPPTPPQGRGEGLSTVKVTNEIFPGNARYASGPYGLGIRVPMMVVSPWSKGGWVSSEVFDHTSMVRFLERRFGAGNPELLESNITPWRRAVAGDLTSAFDFAESDGRETSLPDTSTYLPPTACTMLIICHLLPLIRFCRNRSLVPAGRAVPYLPDAYALVDFADATVRLTFHNAGASAVVFQVRSPEGRGGPWTYTVTSGGRVTEAWKLADYGSTDYDLSVYGPNGFFRSFRGSVSGVGKANLRTSFRLNPHRGQTGSLTIRNFSGEASTVAVLHGYTGARWVLSLPAEGQVQRVMDMGKEFGWYDLTVTVEADPGFEQRLAGHLETGRNSRTDPAIAGL